MSSLKNGAYISKFWVDLELMHISALLGVKVKMDEDQMWEYLNDCQDFLARWYWSL